MNSASATGRTGNADWSKQDEAFAICRRCKLSSVFVLQISNYNAKDLVAREDFWSVPSSLNDLFSVLGFISLKDVASVAPPEHLPQEIDSSFREGATCLAVGCYNAASTMFRLCLDLATRGLLPDEANVGIAQPNRKQRRDLGLRIPWLIEHGRLPKDLGALAGSVKEDGNDGAHVGNLVKVDAEDLLDFTQVLLERLYTEPARIALAEARRVERRSR